MAPNKFEKNIKKQLQEREIQPSASAWESLSEKLNSSAPQSKKRSYFWYGTAASFIGILLVSVVYFNSVTISDILDSQIVDSPKENDEPKNKITIESPQEQVKIEQLVPTNSINKVIQEKSAVANPIENEITIQKVRQENSVDEKMIFIKEIRSRTQEIVNAKILQVAVQVNALEKENIDLTDDEVDSLLRKAQREIIASSVLQSENSMDPMILLTEVEDELDQTFRDKIFESLKTGFVKVRTAVADSDN